MTTRTPRPTIPPVHVGDIPAELRERPQWVAWRYEWQGRKWTKVPLDPRTGRKADTADPATWGTFAQARAHARRQQLGLGYVFAADDPYVGIDLDQCRDPATGALTARASSIVAEVDTFAEISVSGTGVHLIARGTLPGTRRRRSKYAIEMYEDRRFFAVTGHHLPGSPHTIEPRQGTIDWLYGATFGPEPEPAAPTAPQPVTDLDDATLLERATSDRKTGPAFTALWHGDTSAHHGDHSAADLALCSHLAYWSGGDATRIDGIFRRSALYRPKWDERRGALTYGERTIAKALQRTTYYRPAPPPPATAPPAAADPPPSPGDGGTAADLDGEDLDAATPEELRGQLRAEQRRRQAAEARAERAEHELAKVRRRCRDLEQLQSATMAVLRNPHLKAERVTALAVVFDTASEESRGRAREDGSVRLPRARLAEGAGCSEKRAVAHLDRFVNCGLFEKKVESNLVRRIDPDTGEATHHYQSEIYVKRNGSVIDVLQKLATLEPEKPETWGGKRAKQPKTCPDHPDAGTVKRWTLHCAECDQVLDQGEQYRTATDEQSIAPAPAPSRGEGPGDWRAIMTEAAPPAGQDDPPTTPGPITNSASEDRGEPPAPHPTSVPITLALEGQDDPPAYPAGEVTYSRTADPRDAQTLQQRLAGTQGPAPPAARTGATEKPCFNRGCTQRFAPAGRWERYCPGCQAAGWRNPPPVATTTVARASRSARLAEHSPEEEQQGARQLAREAREEEP